MKDTETKQRFVELRVKGLSFDKIAKELETSKVILIQWGKELKNSIANLKAVEMEALQEQYALTVQTKIETYGQLLKSLRDELAQRDLSEVDTCKLVDCIVKLDGLMRLPDLLFQEERSAKRLCHTETWTA
jgi:hypothetical protein